MDKNPDLTVHQSRRCLVRWAAFLSTEYFSRGLVSSRRSSLSIHVFRHREHSLATVEFKAAAAAAASPGSAAETAELGPGESRWFGRLRSGDAVFRCFLRRLGFLVVGSGGGSPSSSEVLLEKKRKGTR